MKERILALIAEKTGYPQDMLDLDLDLEADLGVDTVKQAEMFAGIREIYNIPRDENRKLRDYPTLNHVIRFVYDKRPDLAVAAPVPATPKPTEEIEPIAPALAAAPSPTAVPLAAPAKDGAGDSVKERILALVAEKTGYPQDMLDLDLDLEADLGVDTVKQAEMFAAIREIYNIPRDENRSCGTIRHWRTSSGSCMRSVPTWPSRLRFRQRPRQRKRSSPSLRRLRPFLCLAPAKDGAGDSVKERILALVVEKTGYPQDMLDLDLDLEADLGVDTVKQAEMFAAIRAAYNIPRDENVKLRDYPTLAHVIRFVNERRPDLAVAAPVAATPKATEETEPIAPAPAAAPPAVPAAAPTKRQRRRFRERAHPGAGRGKDRLSARYVGLGSRPRSRPRS